VNRRRTELSLTTHREALQQWAQLHRRDRSGVSAAAAGRPTDTHDAFPLRVAFTLKRGGAIRGTRVAPRGRGQRSGRSLLVVHRGTLPNAGGTALWAVPLGRQRGEDPGGPRAYESCRASRGWIVSPPARIAPEPRTRRVIRHTIVRTLARRLRRERFRGARVASWIPGGRSARVCAPGVCAAASAGVPSSAPTRIRGNKRLRGRYMTNHISRIGWASECYDDIVARAREGNLCGD